jgi:hypothetical protein
VRQSFLVGVTNPDSVGDVLPAAELEAEELELDLTQMTQTQETHEGGVEVGFEDLVEGDDDFSCSQSGDEGDEEEAFSSQPDADACSSQGRSQENALLEHFKSLNEDLTF